jgi:hypothetical protein
MGDNPSTFEQYLFIGAVLFGGIGTLQLLIVFFLDWKAFAMEAATGILFIAGIYFLLFLIAIQLYR